jgi:hypothetical protein
MSSRREPRACQIDTTERSVGTLEPGRPTVQERDSAPNGASSLMERPAVAAVAGAPSGRSRPNGRRWPAGVPVGGGGLPLVGSVFTWWMQVAGAGIERRPSLGRSRPSGRAESVYPQERASRGHNITTDMDGYQAKPTRIKHLRHVISWARARALTSCRLEGYRRSATLLRVPLAPWAAQGWRSPWVALLPELEPDISSTPVACWKRCKGRGPQVVACALPGSRGLRQRKGTAPSD